MCLHKCSGMLVGCKYAWCVFGFDPVYNIFIRKKGNDLWDLMFLLKLITKQILKSISLRKYILGKKNYKSKYLKITSFKFNSSNTQKTCSQKLKNEILVFKPFLMKVWWLHEEQTHTEREVTFE